MPAPMSKETTPTGPLAVRPAEHGSAGDDLDPALDVFLSERSRLFRIAYRILGDPAGAEDVLQEVWLRWQLTDRTRIENPAAYLTTATTHMAIKSIRSARYRHETPTEPQLVNLDDQDAQDPSLRAEQSGAVADALALLMSKLTPEAMAAYVLRKAFGYAYADLAAMLRISVPNARVLVHRAQARLASARVRPVPAESHRRLVTAFQVAVGTGEVEGLTRLVTGTGSAGVPVGSPVTPRRWGSTDEATECAA
ncbi:sigma-70 family RNA polymerase sigma factor [Streptomyces sp. CB02400]|uniref:sigma-70 family RNA polymerase sigma factor n=1 Tax=Streptomyces sp. CB02400 TaxID=1703944 RepID=UPI00093982B4|nr:sigma-70 family RNA polymerase sigma factor [Streptomyces sp. CB02400]